MLLSKIEYDVKNDRTNSIQGPCTDVHIIHFEYCSCEL